MKFIKMQALGNDFIIVNHLQENTQITPFFIQKICHRHYGVGADGLILLEKSDNADFMMRIFNCDGTEGKMCGNGLCCIGKYIYEQGLLNKKEFSIETISGIKKIYLTLCYRNIQNIIVDMGMVHHEKKHTHDYVQIGNEHAVIFVDEYNRQLFSEYSSLNKMNIELVKVIDEHHIQVWVKEKGVGETLACGTGACAAVYAGYMNHLCCCNVEVTLEGGKLDVFLKENHMYIKSLSENVFKGEI